MVPIDKRITLVVTDAAFEALGITPDNAPAGSGSAPDREPAKQGAKSSKSAPAALAASAARKTREGSKQARLVEMLKRPEGVTISEAAKALEWQSHTVRGAIAGALKKKLDGKHAR